MNLPRLVLSGTHSGVGKTTLTLALALAFQARGLKTAVFKCGPDYLDPGWHRLATGRPCHNLDGWLMGRESVRATFLWGAEGADVAIIEGAMGLFDGAGPREESGSTAEIAKWLEAPVVVTADAAGQGRTLAAVAQGMARFDPAVRVAGVVANRVGSLSHRELLTQSLTEPPLLGALPKVGVPQLPARHLGLRTAADTPANREQLAALARLAEDGLDVERLLGLAQSAPPLDPPPELFHKPGSTQEKIILQHSGEPRCRIGVAWDEAFHFYYEHNLRLLEEAGAELVRFSPVAGDPLPNVNGVILGGGYPELYGPALAANRPLWQALAQLAAEGGPVYGECGGLMALSQAILTAEGQRFPMAGLLPGTARMETQRQALGYVAVETTQPTVLGPSGLRFRGHQFRYSRLEDAQGGAYQLTTKRTGAASLEGYQQGNVLGSYVHAHWASCPQAPQGLVNLAAAHKSRCGSGRK